MIEGTACAIKNNPLEDNEEIWDEERTWNCPLWAGMLFMF